MDDFIVI